ncbi:BglG family transcription antiterminator [Clavibacter sepedonicus]|uniref:PTS system antitermination regulator n=1 Tax=Clavibacter sepedonicus TaxID=31964 RepID=B0RB61_CLASE|nr:MULTISPECIES: PTS sugar transporter subunit IIA [Clavibacter]MBD5380717.1 PTS transporter subunit EIIA [Clavibacter sp.]OQJ48860.1 transcriptional antiterminator [Clavibacter sepedonicus]OQJ54406.1 transcriptional antiterminator [Clavibacter sepedonicus]CAQ00426.1 putative PTS system antitermination regulator [Clavibacter sepedonicus]
MLSENQERLLDYLSTADRWVEAGELADRLGVTTRSVRNYVTAVRERSTVAIASSPDGYRIDAGSYARHLGTRSGADQQGTPRDRLHALVRRLGDAPDGLDVFALADELHVSESTVEADLRKVRALVEDAGLALRRTGSIAVLEGSERDFRRLLSRMFRDESAQGFLPLETVQREFASDSLRAFKTDLVRELTEGGFFVNEYGVDNVLLHVAIAVDRLARSPRRTDAGADPSAGADLDPAPAADDAAEGPAAADPTALAIRAVLARLLAAHFDVPVPAGDVAYLALLVRTRVVTPGNEQSLATVMREHVVESDLDVVRAIVRRVKQEYLVDLEDEDFTVRFSLHLGNLVARAADRSFSRNPLARSIKTSYPMTYEIAVFIASEVQRRRGIAINDDEIAYIALHVGSHRERIARRDDRVACALVCPNYYDLHQIMRQRIEQALGADISVDAVVTRTDVDADALGVQLVINATGTRPPGDDVVVVQPLPTPDDIESIRQAVARVRRHARRSSMKHDLLRFLDESLFFRDLHAPDEEAMIRLLGGKMVEQGIIEPEYIDGAIERERLSSTAFTDTLAVPHSLAMTAHRTAIAIVVNDEAMQWGGNRVHVVALVAFSASGRTSFQHVFDQFVEVFSDHRDVQAIMRASGSHGSFIEELVHVMDT